MANLDTLQTALFEQLETLSSATTPEKVKEEIERSKAMTGIGSQLIGSAKVQLEFLQMTKTTPDATKPGIFTIEHKD